MFHISTDYQNHYSSQIIITNSVHLEFLIINENEITIIMTAKYYPVKLG